MEELYPTNYLREERNYLKITTDQVVGLSSFSHLLLENGGSGLEEKMLSKDSFGDSALRSRREYKNRNI